MAQDELNILIVDDEKDLCEDLSARFRAFNYKTISAFSGREALEIVKSQKIDIIVSDVRMKGGNGIDLLKEVRKINNHDPKVFLVSGYDDLNKQDIFNLGVDGFFEKPFDSRSLMNAIRKVRMSNMMRWQLTMNYIPSKLYFFKDQTIAHLDQSREVSFGRGGFCIDVDDVPVVGDRVEFHFKFDADEDVNEVRGMGLVQWVRLINNGSSKKSIGVEIEHVHATDVEAFAKWIEERDSQSYIPIKVSQKKSA